MVIKALVFDLDDTLIMDLDSARRLLRTFTPVGDYCLGVDIISRTGRR